MKALPLAKLVVFFFLALLMAFRPTKVVGVVNMGTVLLNLLAYISGGWLAVVVLNMATVLLFASPKFMEWLADATVENAMATVDVASRLGLMPKR